MRTPVDCPFNPGSDTVPEIWAGRREELDDWHQVLRPRRLAGRAERGRTILGEPGTGKSCLVNRISEEARHQGDWTTGQLRIPRGTDPLRRLARALVDLARQAGLTTAREHSVTALIRRVEKIAAAGVSLSLRDAQAPEPYTDLTDLLIEIGRSALRARNTMVLIHLDEVQNIDDDDVRSQLLVALGDALTHEETVQAPGGYSFSRVLPLAVYLTGLPEFAEMAGARTGATFARRFKTTVLEAISDEDLEMALEPFVADGWEVPDDQGGLTRISMHPDARRAIIQLSCGEPFLFQLAGEQAWNAGTSEVITERQAFRGWERAADAAETHVERILQRLPTREREFLDAMVALPAESRTLSAIAEEAGYAKSSQAGPTSQRLDVVRGIIQRRGRGKVYRFRNRAVEALLATDWPYEERA